MHVNFNNTDKIPKDSLIYDCQASGNNNNKLILNFFAHRTQSLPYNENDDNKDNQHYYHTHKQTQTWWYRIVITIKRKKKTKKFGIKAQRFFFGKHHNQFFKLTNKSYIEIEPR